MNFFLFNSHSSILNKIKRAEGFQLVVVDKVISIPETEIFSLFICSL